MQRRPDVDGAWVVPSPMLRGDNGSEAGDFAGTIASVSRTSNIVQLSLLAASGLNAGETITVAGMAGSGSTLNGTFQVADASDVNLSYYLPGADIAFASETGTVTASGRQRSNPAFATDGDETIAVGTIVGLVRGYLHTSQQNAANLSLAISGDPNSGVIPDAEATIDQEWLIIGSAGGPNDICSATCVELHVPTSLASTYDNDACTETPTADSNRYCGPWCVRDTACSSGDSATITHVARTSNVVTITTSAAHGFSVGDVATVAGLAGAGVDLNGDATITAVTSTTFTYTLAGSNIASTTDTGTVTVKSCTQCIAVYKFADANGKLLLTSTPSEDGCTNDYTVTPKQYLVGCFTLSDQPTPGSIPIIDTTKPFFSTRDPDHCTNPPVWTVPIVYLTGAFSNPDDPVKADFIAEDRTRTQFVNLQSGAIDDIAVNERNLAALQRALANHIDPEHPYFGADILMPPGTFYVPGPGINITSKHSGLRLGGSNSGATTELYGDEPTAATAIQLANGSDVDTIGPIRFFSNGGPAAITHVARTSNVVTITVSVPTFYFVVGDILTVAHLAGAGATLNGRFTVTAVSSSTFSYALAGSNIATTADTGTATPNFVLGLFASPQLGPVTGFKIGDVMMGAPTNSTQIRNPDQWMAYITGMRTSPYDATLLEIFLDRPVKADVAYQTRWFHDALLLAGVSAPDTAQLESTADLAFFGSVGLVDYLLTDGAGINEVVVERVTSLRGSTVSGTSYIQFTRRFEFRDNTAYVATGNLCLIRGSSLLNDVTLHDFRTGYTTGKGLIDCRFINMVFRGGTIPAGFNPTSSAGLLVEKSAGYGSVGPVDGMTFRDSTLIAFPLEEWSRHITYDKCRIEWQYFSQVGCEWLSFNECEFNGDTSISQFITLTQFISGKKTNHLSIQNCRVNNNFEPIPILGDNCRLVGNTSKAGLGFDLTGLNGFVENNTGGEIVLESGSTGVYGHNDCEIIDGSAGGWHYYLTDANFAITSDGGVAFLYFKDRCIDPNGTDVVLHIPDAGGLWSDPLTPGVPHTFDIQSNRIFNTIQDQWRYIVTSLPVADVTWSADMLTPATGGWNTGFIFNFQDNGNHWAVRTTATTVKIYKTSGGGAPALMDTASFTFANATHYRLKVITAGDNVRCYVDATQTNNYTTASRPFKFSTAFGVENFHDVTLSPNPATFSDFLATPTGTPISPWAGSTAVAVKGSATPAAKNLVEILLGLTPALPLTDSTITDTYLEDSFTGANGTVIQGRGLDYGAVWVKSGSGIATIQSNKLALTTTSGGFTYFWDDAGHADAVVEVDVTFPSSDGYLGILGRLSDASNYLAVVLDDHSDANLISLAKTVSGSGSTIGATVGYTIASSTTYKVTAIFLGNDILVAVNGIWLLTRTDSFNNTATKFGVVFYDPFGTPTVDNFRVRAIPRPMPVDAATLYGTIPSTIFATPVGSALTSAKIWVGNGSNVAAAVTVSGDATLSNAGVVTIANAAVTLAKIANASANSKLVGAGASGSGASYAEITLGTGLSMSGTTLNASASAPRRVAVVYADTSTTHTDGTFDPILTATIPANTLIANGDSLEFTLASTCVAQHTVDTREWKVSFGSITINDSGALAFLAAGTVEIRGTIIRFDSGSARAIVTYLDTGLTQQPVILYKNESQISGLNWTSNITLLLLAATAGTGAAAADIVGKMATVTYWPSP